MRLRAAVEAHRDPLVREVGLRRVRASCSTKSGTPSAASRSRSRARRRAPRAPGARRRGAGPRRRRAGGVPWRPRPRPGAARGARASSPRRRAWGRRPRGRRTRRGRGRSDGPVEVVEHHHDRPPSGEVPEERAGGRERRVGALQLAERRRALVERGGAVCQLAERQEVMPWPYGVHAASSTTASTSSANAATRRLLPIPASPTTTTWPGFSVSTTRSNAARRRAAPPHARPAARDLARPRADRAHAEETAVGVQLERVAAQARGDRGELNLVRCRVAERTPRAAHRRADEHGRRALHEQPPGPDREPRLEHPDPADLATSTPARRADDIVLVRAVGAERSDELDSRIRRERAAVTRTTSATVRGRPGRPRPRPRARGRRRRAARRGAARPAVAPADRRHNRLHGASAGSCERIIRWSARSRGRARGPTARRARGASPRSVERLLLPPARRTQASGDGRAARDPVLAASRRRRESRRRARRARSRPRSRSSSAVSRSSSSRAISPWRKLSYERSANGDPRHSANASRRAAERSAGGSGRASWTSRSKRRASTTPGSARSEYPPARVSIASFPSACRRRDTAFCTTASAVGGGRPAQRSSISVSLETTEPACSTRSASTARCRGPPSEMLFSPARTSSGPSTRNAAASFAMVECGDATPRPRRSTEKAVSGSLA